MTSSAVAPADSEANAIEHPELRGKPNGIVTTAKHDDLRSLFTLRICKLAKSTTELTNREERDHENEEGDALAPLVAVEPETSRNFGKQPGLLAVRDHPLGAIES